MPYTATSLGKWMKTHFPSELGFTATDTHGRTRHGSPRGAKAAYRTYYPGADYLARFGKAYRDETPSGSVERLRVGLVGGNQGVFAFPPQWAKRLPYLNTELDIEARLIALTPGDSVCPGASSRFANKMPTVYKDVNDKLDYWVTPPTGGAGCCLTSVWAKYDVTDVLREGRGTTYRQLESPRVLRARMGPYKTLPEFIPDERKETATRFLDRVYVDINLLKVLGLTVAELNSVYHFFILEPDSIRVVVVDNRANVIVAILPGQREPR